MNKKDNIFTKTYQLNESTRVCFIEIALNQYAHIFNKWDCAPLERREVDPELESYLKRCCEEIPFKYSLELYFTIPAEIKNYEKEEKSRDGLKNHFTLQIYLLKKKLNRNNRNIFLYVLGGFFLLWIVAIWQIDISRILLSIIEDGLLIGGWVFWWEAVSTLFFANSEVYESYRTYKRLLNSLIVFREAESV